MGWDYDQWGGLRPVGWGYDQWGGTINSGAELRPVGWGGAMTSGVAL